jgi:hypothetical protein
MKTRIGICVALLVTLVGGWLWGASGRWDRDRALQAAELRNDLLEARAALLGARVYLCDADFEGMSRQLESARKFVGNAGARIGTTAPVAQPPGLDLAGFGADLDEAQRLVAKLNPGARAALSR